MLLLAVQAVTGALEHIHLQFHLCVLLLGILNLVAEQVEVVLGLLGPDLVLLQLSPLDGELAAGRLQLFSLLGNFGLVLCLSGLQLGDLVCASLEAIVEHLDLLL